jgi:hypothetical protein
LSFSIDQGLFDGFFFIFLHLVGLTGHIGEVEHSGNTHQFLYEIWVEDLFIR